MMRRLISLLSLLLVACYFAYSAKAEQYETGTHTLKNPSGVLTVNSGYVHNINAHTFNVYTFMFKPKDEKKWQQVPIVDSSKDSKLKFDVATSSTPEFMLRDAKVTDTNGEFMLSIAEKLYKESRYDDAPVTLKQYKLMMTDQEERWVFLLQKTQTLPAKSTVENALK